MNIGLSKEALDERRKGIGGSDAGRISRQLWLEKTQRTEPEDLSGNLAVNMGTFTEPFNCFWFEKVTGRKVTRRNETVVSERYPWMRANLDGVTVTRTGEPAYIDFKHVGKADEAMIKRYTPQMTHCCTILGLDYWVLSVFVGNGKHEIFDQEADPLYMSQLIARERDFWGYVERDEDPGDRFEEKPPVPKPQPKLREIVAPVSGWETTDDPIDQGIVSALIRKENWLGDAVWQARIFANTHAAATRHAIAREKIKTLVPDDVGRLDFGLLHYRRDGRGVTISLDKETE